MNDTDILIVVDNVDLKIGAGIPPTRGIFISIGLLTKAPFGGDDSCQTSSSDH